MTNRKPRAPVRARVQFSKKIVVAVTVCVTALSLIGVVLCFAGGGLTQLESVIQVYIQFAMVVFVAYSGNSATEKWLMYRGGAPLNMMREQEQEAEG